MATQIQHLVKGARVAGSGRTAPVFNPATGEQSGLVPLASRAEVDEAVAAVKCVFPPWPVPPPLRRARILNRFLRLLEENIDQLSAVIIAEHCKVLSDAKGEIQRGMEVVEFAVGAPQLLNGEVTENVGTRVDSHSLRQPLGVVGGITPFNFPAMGPMWMFPVALACGNCFILKPSQCDPFASLLMADWLKEAGLPDGVFSVVHGDKEAVDALLHNPDVAGVSFIGSTPIARYIYQTAAFQGKRAQALGGAKNHMIVMPDADLDQAVDVLMGATYGSVGERCMAISVAVPIGEKTADALIERLIPKVRGLKVRPGTDPEAEMGPLVTKQHLERCAAMSAQVSRKAPSYWSTDGRRIGDISFAGGHRGRRDRPPRREPAEALGGRLSQHYPGLAVTTGNDPAGYDIAVNATPLGMAEGDPSPTNVDRIDPATFVGEVVMKQEVTPFLRAVQAKGCRIQVGTDMLFEQIPAYLEFFGFPTTTPDELREVARLAY